MTEPPAGTVARAVQVLRVLAEADTSVSVSGLADELGLPRPTAHRLLGLLADQGMVFGRDGRYGIGEGFFRLAALVQDRHDLVKTAQPFMRQVVIETGETCLLGVFLRSERQMSFASEVASPHPLGYRIALHAGISVVWGASGRAILANLPADEVGEILQREGPSPVTGRKAPSLAKIRDELEEIRARGYAYSEGQKIPGSRGIAAPVMGPHRTALASLCVTIPDVRFEPGSRESIGGVLASRAAALSHVLGAS